MRRIWLALLALALTGCSYLEMTFAAPISGWSANVEGVAIDYRVAEGPQGGTAWWDGRRCRVTLHKDLFVAKELYVHIAAHEVGHCMDGAKLSWSSNGVANEGCKFGDHYCTSREGYAEFYARTYIEACGYSTSPLGLWPADSIECELPDPRMVGP